MKDRSLRKILIANVHQINDYLDELISRGDNYLAIARKVLLTDQPIGMKSAGSVPEIPPTDPKNPPPGPKSAYDSTPNASGPSAVPEIPPKDPILNPPPSYLTTEDLKPLRDITRNLETQLKT